MIGGVGGCRRWNEFGKEAVGDEGRCELIKKLNRGVGKSQLRKERSIEKRAKQR